MPVVFGEEAALEPGRIYVAPPDHYMLLEAPGRIRVVRGNQFHNTRPGVDPLFALAAATFGRVVGLVLNGRGKGAPSANHDGLALVQDPVEAPVPKCRRRPLRRMIRKFC